MDYLQKLIGDIEVHSVDGIKECFEETFIPAVNPMGYAILKAAYGIDYTPSNVPNKYLTGNP